MARYPTRDEWGDESVLPPGTDVAMSRLGLDDDEDGLTADCLGSRKEPRLSRRPKPRKINRRKNRLDVDGMLTESEFRELRRQVFARADRRCEKCGRRGSLQTHHRKLLAHGGPDAACNLASLCPDCHAYCHQHPRAAQAGGWIVPSWADPAPRPLILWSGQVVLLAGDCTYELVA